MGRKKQRRTSRSAAVYIPACVLLILTLTILGTSVFLRVLEVEVIGSSMYSQDEILNASGIMIGDNLLFLDTEGIRLQLVAAMPFIREVTITRVPPYTLRIEIAESTAIAKIAFLDSTLVIDSGGRILSLIEGSPATLIEIRGFTPVDVVEGSQLRAELGGSMQLEYMIDMLSAIEREGMYRSVSYLDVTNISAISFGYRDRYRVILGGPGNVRSKLRQLPGAVANIETRDASDVPYVINMSDPSGEWNFKPDTT